MCFFLHLFLSKDRSFWNLTFMFVYRKNICLMFRLFFEVGGLQNHCRW